MRLSKIKRPLKLGSALLGVLLVIFTLIGPVLPIPGLPAAIAYAQSCPGGPQPGSGYARVGVCLTNQAGNQLTSASGYTVRVTQKVGTQTLQHGTTFFNGLFITNSNMAPVGQPLGSCTGNASIPYQLTIIASKGTATSRASYNACNDSAGFIYVVSLAVSPQGGQYGSVKGCITYTAPDGTTQPFDGSPTTQGSPATATITGPSGPASKSITVGFNAQGCLTGTQINNLPVGSYTINAVYAPGQTPHGLVGTLTYQKTFTITANKTTDVSGKATTSSSPTGGGGTSQTPQIQCTILSFNPLNWFICPLVDAAQGAVNQLTSAIDGMLTVDTNSTFGNNQTGNGFKSAWSTFRLFAIGIIIIAGLVMLIAQGLSMDFIDAYTIRKVLPRMVVMIIFITLSWYVLEFLIGLSNDVGNGIRFIIYEPFKNISGDVNVGNGAVSVGFLVGAAGILALGLVGLLSFVLAAFLALFVGFIVLIIRKIIIIMLVITAPLALACYILPNTEKAWKFWKDTLISMLIVFPIISAIIAAGRVFAVVTYNSPGNATINQITAFIAYFLPYFMLPFAFKLAGGAVAALHGVVQNKAGGISGGLQKFRQNRMAQNMHDLGSGNRFKSDNWAATRFNHATSAVAAVPNAGFNPRRMRSRMQSAMSRNSMTEAAEYGEKNAEFGVIKGNDDWLNAGLEGEGNDGKVREYLRGLTDNNGNRIYSDASVEQGVAAVRAARRATGSEVFETAATMALPATGTAFAEQRDANGNLIGGGAGEMHDKINKVAGTDRVKATNMLAAMRAGATGARRFDEAGGSFGSQASVLQQQYEGTMSATDATKRIVRESLEGQGGSYIAGARTGAVKAFAPAMLEKLTDVANSGDRVAFKHELATIAGRYDAMASVSPDSARILANGVLSKDVNGQNVRDLIEQFRQDPDFLNMRREYGAAASSGAGQAQIAAAQAAQQMQGPQGPVQPPPLPGPMGGP